MTTTHKNSHHNVRHAHNNKSAKNKSKQIKKKRENKAPLKRSRVTSHERKTIGYPILWCFITTDFMEYIDLYAYSGGVYVHDANLTEVC